MIIYKDEVITIINSITKVYLIHSVALDTT
jgi:hypothetical protein